MLYIEPVRTNYSVDFKDNIHTAIRTSEPQLTNKGWGVVTNANSPGNGRNSRNTMLNKMSTEQGHTSGFKIEIKDLKAK